jgi:hypothetical protein
MPTASPSSRTSTRKSRTPSPKPKSKRPYTRRTGRERIGQRIGKIEKAVGEIKSLVDSHCGDTALKTARAAAVAAAEEVLEATGLTPTPTAGSGTFVSNQSGFRKLAPGENNLSQNFAARQFNTPPPLETLRPQTVALTKSRKAKKLAAVAANAAAEFNAIANGAAVAAPLVPMAAAAAARPKSIGPKLWNEFLKNYMRNQAAAGRKLTRLEAMAEAGPNYRRKHGLPEPKPKKPKTAAALGANAVQVAAVEEPAVAKTPRARTKKAVRVLAPGSLAAKTPGRLSPPLYLNNGSGAGNRGEVNSPTPNVAFAARTPNGAVNGNANAPRTPNGNANAPRTPNGNANAPRTPNGNANAPRTPNGNAAGFPLSPATYGYEDEGLNADTGQRKVLVGDREYFLGENGSLFGRSGNSMEEWVGYLEPSGEIRYTNAP